MEIGKMTKKEALSNLELVHLLKIGALESFNTDGLRSLLYALDIHEIKEKTLRYLGHAEK